MSGVVEGKKFNALAPGSKVFPVSRSGFSLHRLLPVQMSLYTVYVTANGCKLG